jgi:hypothetical protein
VQKSDGKLNNHIKRSPGRNKAGASLIKSGCNLSRQTLSALRYLFTALTVSDVSF